MPQLLTPDEIKLLLDNTPNPMYRALFMTIYDSGLRVSEAVNLKVSDIDSVKMRIRTRKGKGDTGRFATLSVRCLDELRDYRKIYRPKDDLFFTRLKKKPSTHSVYNALHASVERAGTIVFQLINRNQY